MATSKERLISLYPYLMHSVEKAKEEGEVQLGILSVKPDGTGQIISQFQADEFLADLAAVIEAPPVTKEQFADAEAAYFLSKHGLND